MRDLQKYGCVLLLFIFLLGLGLFSPAQAAGGQISGVIWVEKTADGEMSKEETGYEGAIVTLEERQADGSSAFTGSTVSSKSGDFAFSSLRDGEYRLKIEVASDYHFTRFGLGSDALPAQGKVSYTPYFSIENGRAVEKNVGVTKNYATVSVVAFEDSNANGGRMTSEPLLRSVRIEVQYEYNLQWITIASASTDRDGEAVIRDLSPGDYRLFVTLPTSYVMGPLGQKINLFYNCVFSNGDNTGFSDPFSVETRETFGMGIGAVKAGSLSGRIWKDENVNGRLDAGEGGLSGAAVTLYSPASHVSIPAFTDESGVYRFSSVTPGDYDLYVDLPNGMIFTLPGASLLSDIIDHGTVSGVTVQADRETKIGDVGAINAVSLTLNLYRDDNLNGQKDDGEIALSGASVVISQNGRVIDRTTTDDRGDARFAMLRPGAAELDVTLPERYVFAADQAGLFSITTAALNQAQTRITLDSADTVHVAPVTMLSTISGSLFDDPAGNGIQEDGDEPLPGFSVQALNEAGQIMAQTVTDQAGRYTLSPLLPGSYTVRFLLGDTYVASPLAVSSSPVLTNDIVAQTPEYGDTSALFLAPGQDLTGVDGAVFKAGMVDGQVLLGDGAKGLPGVNVTLLDGSGMPYSDYSYGVTDETGSYSIKGVLPGAYTLLYTLPDGCAFEEPLLDASSYESAAFVSVSGSSVHMPTLRGIYTASLGGVILHDDVDLDDAFSAKVTLSGRNTGRSYEYTVGEDGAYAFYGLRPDAYTLTVSLPESLVFGQYEGSPITPVASSHASAEIALGMGDQWLDADILAGMSLRFTGFIFYDENQSAIQEEESGAEDRTILLYAGGEEIDRQTTDEDGYFVFDHLLPGYYELRLPLDDHEVVVATYDAWKPAREAWTLAVSFSEDTDLFVPILRYASVFGQVWSLDGTLNGVSHIPVSLLNEEGKVLSTCVTGSQGEYAFEGNLLPGKYTLSAQLPDGYLFAGSLDALTRESLIQTGADGGAYAVPFTVPMGDELSGMDIGIGAMGSIGDRAWLDENGNGMQDLEEPNMPGILIELYRNGDLVASTTTDLYGRYLFADLYPGEYEMRVTMPPEIKATLRQTEFPLVASILPESEETTVSFTGVVVPSGGQNLHCDLGFLLREEGVYPAIMNEIPVKDWRPYSDRK